MAVRTSLPHVALWSGTLTFFAVLFYLSLLSNEAIEQKIASGGPGRGMDTADGVSGPVDAAWAIIGETNDASAGNDARKRGYGRPGNITGQHGSGGLRRALRRAELGAGGGGGGGGGRGGGQQKGRAPQDNTQPTALNYHSAEQRENGRFSIPRLLHQTWETVLLPGQVVSWMTSWPRHHPHWRFRFWTEEGTLRYLRDNYPAIFSIYLDYPTKINRADVRRYVFMYEFGGVYADLDVECLRPLDGLLSQHSCIIAQEPEVHQALLYGYRHANYILPGFMACRAGHPFFKAVLESLPLYAHRARELDWNDNVLKSTGPMFLSEVYEGYRKTVNGSLYPVYVAPSDWLMPSFDNINLGAYRTKCAPEQAARLSARQLRVCRSLRGRGYNNTVPEAAYTDHHWLHTWGTGFVPQGFVSLRHVWTDAKYDVT